MQILTVQALHPENFYCVDFALRDGPRGTSCFLTAFPVDLKRADGLIPKEKGKSEGGRVAFLFRGTMV